MSETQQESAMAGPNPTFGDSTRRSQSSTVPERGAERGATDADLRWILREACWSRMSGKADAQNPFAK